MFLLGNSLNLATMTSLCMSDPTVPSILQEPVAPVGLRISKPYPTDSLVILWLRCVDKIFTHQATGFKEMQEILSPFSRGVCSDPGTCRRTLTSQVNASAEIFMIMRRIPKDARQTQRSVVQTSGMSNRTQQNPGRSCWRLHTGLSKLPLVLKMESGFLSPSLLARSSKWQPMSDFWELKNK